MKIFGLILITVILTAGLAGGGTYYYIKNKDNLEISKLQTQINQLKKNQATKPSQTKEAQTWKTYKNSRVFYQFEYPDNLKNDLQESVKYPTSSGINKRIDDMVQFDSNSISYALVADKEKVDRTLENWMKDASENFANTNLANYQQITIDGQPGYQAKDSLITVTKKGEFVYIIIGHTGLIPSSNVNDPTYKHLVETFKFIN
jgi:hypothetical protein